MDEKPIIIFARRHWAAFLGNILVAIFLLVIPITIILIAHQFLPNAFSGKILNFIVVFGSIYYLIILTLIFSAWISYYYDIYILNRDSIVDINQSGFFNRKISQLPLASMENVSSTTKGFLPTFFGYGNIVIETAGARVENFLLKDVPKPQYFSDKVMETRDKLLEEEKQIEREEPNTEIKEVITMPKQPYVGRPGTEGEVSKDELNQGGEVKL